jgi:hypothetical protein
VRRAGRSLQVTSHRSTPRMLRPQPLSVHRLWGEACMHARVRTGPLEVTWKRSCRPLGSCGPGTERLPADGSIAMFPNHTSESLFGLRSCSTLNMSILETGAARVVRLLGGSASALWASRSRLDHPTDVVRASRMRWASLGSTSRNCLAVTGSRHIPCLTPYHVYGIVRGSRLSNLHGTEVPDSCSTDAVDPQTASKLYAQGAVEHPEQT